jgi:hypothetical protein
MKRYVNLMSPAAQFRSLAGRRLRRWGTALAILALVLAPAAITSRAEGGRVRREHEALEALYEPVRRLNALNRQLRIEATNLVRDEQLVLELSRERPTVALLGVVSTAAAGSDGQLFIEQLSVIQRPPGAAAEGAGQQRLVIDAAAPLAYDVATFVEALHQAPVTAVKVVADEVVSKNGLDRKNYTLECAY